MTRQRSRWLPALLAVLVAFPLWALPHNSAQAAVKDAEFTRLSGPTRYSTSVQIAEAYMDHVDDLPGESRVDTVIMGSGLDEHVGWVAPVPLLSRLERAPLVFTRPDEVPVPVAKFLQRRAVRKVILLGGTEVISADVADELADMGIEEIERLGSDDVHLHAVAVAESFDHPAGDFPKKGRTALLATSGVFADALAAGPMAYQGEYPILLTPQDRLHPAVFDYLVASDIEHLIILGGTAAVGTAVQRALSGLDFTIVRIAGTDRYATAVRLAETQLDEDGLRPCFDGAELGLAFGGLSPDAIASGPLLGELCAPLLLTPSDALPRSVALFLRSDKWVTGDADNDLAVTVFGGTAVVPTEAVTQFFERATTLVPIGGRISVQLDPDTETTDEFTVSFDSEVDAKKAAKAVELAMFEINYERVFLVDGGGCTFTGANVDPDLLYGCARVRLGRVTVQLSEELEAGDLITVTGGQRIGPNNGPRPVARFSYVIPEPDKPVDRDAPDVEIIAPAGHDEFAVLVIEANPLNPPALTDDLASRITVVAADGSPKALRGHVGPTEGLTGTREPHDRYLFTLDTKDLEPGDVISVPRGAFLDKDGRRSPQKRHVVRDHSVDFRIESVTIGDVQSANAASVTLNPGTQLKTAPTGTLTITARRDGIASGSRGNEWRIYGIGLPESSEDANDDAGNVEPQISVLVNQDRRLIRYSILAGEPTFNDLAEELAANSDFAANFTVSTADVTDDSESIGGTVAAGRQFAGGGTAVGIRVRFSDPVSEIVEPPDLQSDENCIRFALVLAIAPSLDAQRDDSCILRFAAPDDLIHLTLSSASTARLPERADLVFIDGNTANDYAMRDSVAQGWLSIRHDPEVPAD
ncbi:cell wall-binding repeat-containing protein [Candidatus Poriferisodalis sp.]|uniref:cell wall-binding repeat-containing protein n=1 Tax=Candidatus Poriferisodalis sp. TaxID=3101277 RepID=UPI003B02A4C5